MEMTSTPELSIDDFCNVAAIHVELVCTEKNDGVFARGTLVVDISRKENESATLPQQLTRTTFGAVDKDVSGAKS